MNVITTERFFISEEETIETPPSYSDGFRAELHDCRACSAREGATQPVAGLGPSNARVLFLGSSPSAEDDASGQAFTGPVGAELEVWLERIGLKREHVALSYTIRCQLVNSRPAKIGETIACRSIWLGRELEALPEVRLVVPLGNPATQALLGLSMKADHKALFWQRGMHGDRSYGIFPLPHPTFILRTVTLRQQFLSGALPIVAAEWRKEWPELFA